MRRLLVTLVAIGLPVGLASCDSGDGSVAAGTEIQISGTEMAFAPSDPVTSRGQHRIVFTNDGAVDHELAIAAPDGKVLVARSIAAGVRTTLEVDLDVVGRYALLCREPGHTEAGMVGTLTVTR